MRRPGENAGYVALGVGLIIVTIAAVCVVAFMSAKYENLNDKYKKVARTAKPLVAGNDQTRLKRFLKNAKKGSDDVFYVDAQRHVLGSEKDFAMLSATDQKTLIKQFNAEGISVLHEICYKLDGINKDWSAGYCTYEVIKTFGPAKGPVG